MKMMKKNEKMLLFCSRSKVALRPRVSRLVVKSNNDTDGRAGGRAGGTGSPSNLPPWLALTSLLFSIAFCVWSQLLHGLATFSVMAYFCEYDLAEVITPMLLMEVNESILG